MSPLSFSTLALLLGLGFGLPQIYGLVQPAAFGAAVRKFSRSVKCGYVLMLLATAWASSVEHQLGTTIGTDAARRGAECLAGAWAADTASSLSPGDLDEAVTVLVAAGKGTTDRGTAFERVAAFRAGFKHGPSKCVQSS